MEHGRSLEGLEPSSYLATLQPHLAKGYPLGAVMPVGVGREIVGGEAPLALPPVCRAHRGHARTRPCTGSWEVSWPDPGFGALAAFVGAQSALLYGYALWGGLKEVAGAAAIAACSRARVAGAEGAIEPARLPPARASPARGCSASSAPGRVLWLLPALGTAIAVTLLTPPARDGLRAIGAFAAFVVVLALPTLVAAPSFLGNRIFEFDYLANLVQPLTVAQLAGIWPVGDFRFVPGARRRRMPSSLWSSLAAAGGSRLGGSSTGLGAARSTRPARWAAASLFFRSCTPWIEGEGDGDGGARPSPSRPCSRRARPSRVGRRVEGAVLAALVTGGVLWSNVLQYHDAWLGPREQLAELEEIGERFAGQGPALMTEFNPYGVRHLLRRSTRRALRSSASGRFPYGTGSARARARRRTSTIRPGGATGVPHARAASLACREPPAVRLPARFVRPLVRRLAARPAPPSQVLEHLPSR